MVSQASSENSTSIGVRDEDAAAAVEVLDNEFAKEIEEGPCSLCTLKAVWLQWRLWVRT